MCLPYPTWRHAYRIDAQNIVALQCSRDRPMVADSRRSSYGAYRGTETSFTVAIPSSAVDTLPSPLPTSVRTAYRYCAAIAASPTIAPMTIPHTAPGNRAWLAPITSPDRLV